MNGDADPDDYYIALNRWERATGVIHRYGEADGVPDRAGSATVLRETNAGQLWFGLSRSRGITSLAPRGNMPSMHRAKNVLAGRGAI